MLLSIHGDDDENDPSDRREVQGVYRQLLKRFVSALQVARVLAGISGCKKMEMKMRQQQEVPNRVSTLICADQ